MLLADKAVPQTASFFPLGPANTWHIVKIQSLPERIYIALSVFAFTKSRTEDFSIFSGHILGQGIRTGLIYAFLRICI